MRGVSAAWALVLLALALAPLLGACKDKGPAGAVDAGAAPSPSASSPSALSAEQAGQVLAHVGDRTITLGDFNAALEHMDRFDRMRYQSLERRKELLREMIDVMLLADEARAKGYDKDPVTEQEVRQVLRDALLKKAREDAPTAADLPAAEVHAYYDAHKADFRDPERRRVAAIVLASKAAADQALSVVQADPTKWGETVRARSIDPQAKANVPVDLAGDLGFTTGSGEARGQSARVPEPVRDAAFQLPAVGAIAAATVQAGPKFYVVKLSSKTDAHERSFEEAEHAIRVKLAQEKTHGQEEALLGDLRKKFAVQVDETHLAQVKVEMPAVDAGPPQAP